MKNEKKKTPMTKKKRKPSIYSCTSNNCGDNMVSEIQFQLLMLSRAQLEKLICLLSQELVSLEHKLQTCASCNVSAGEQSENYGSQTINKEHEKSRLARTQCTVVQKVLQFVLSVSLIEEKKSEDIRQQKHLKPGHLPMFDDSNCISDVNEENVCDKYNNSNEVLAEQYTTHYDHYTCANTELLPCTKDTKEDLMKTQTVSNNAFHQAPMKNTKCLNNEKQTQLLSISCEDRKKPLNTAKNEPVNMENLQQVTDECDMESFTCSDSGKCFIWEKGIDTYHHRCINRSVEDKQPLEKSSSLSEIPSETESLQLVHKIPSETISIHHVHIKASEANSSPHVLKIPSEREEDNEIACVCCFCKVHFQEKLILTEHMKKEHNCTQYVCLICGKSFKYKHSLKSHQQGSHTGATVLCSYCGKLVFQTRLDLHMEKVHENPMYTCHICQKGFLKRECLEGHINKHSNTKPYICEHCGRKYAYSTSLSSHRKQCVRASMPPHLQHTRSLDKCTSCVCEICGLQFEGVSGLKDHLSAKHSNKVQCCNFCGKEFHWRPSYNRHIKNCKDKTDLERDRRRWLENQKSAIKHYMCVCGKQYPYRQSFRRHERNCDQKQEIQRPLTN